MMKKGTITGITAIALLITVSLQTVILLKANKPAELIFVHNLSGNEKTAITALIEQFSLENEDIEVEIIYEEAVKMREDIFSGVLTPDIFLWEGPVEKEFPFDNSDPRRWMGTGWTLAVNRALIPEEIYTSLVSSENIEELETAINLLKQQGITPLSIGNSHLWPLAIWSQHIIISEKDGDVSYTPGSDIGKSAYRNSWEILRRWNEKGYFLSETWNEGWPKGVAAVARGEAALTLLSDKMLTAISPEFRNDMEFIKFPQGRQKSWRIGSGTSIVTNLDSPEKAEALMLMDYLTEPEVTKQLTYQLNRFFYSREDEGDVRHISSWQELSNSEEMRLYGTELKHFVENE